MRLNKNNLPRLILICVVVVLFALSPIGAATFANAQQFFSTSSEGDTPPSWLASADSAEQLATDRSYAILAGKLINLGLVNTSACPDNGMLGNGNASPCGEIAAHGAVILWQNQYDEQILLTAGQEGVPPYLLKNILATESQFWPSRHLTIYGYYEYGLGHITQMGADTLLHWNEPVYLQFCRSVYTTKTCEKPYTWLKPEEKATLRGAVLRTVSGDCEHCVGGVNLTQAKASIPVVAAAVKANYTNMLWMLKEHTGRDPKTSFETSDLWRLASADYNAGPGCMEAAIKQTISYNLKPNWKNISDQFDEGCAGAIQYVDTVSNVDMVDSVNLESALLDTNKASMMVLGNEFISPTPKPTLEEPTATLEFTETPSEQPTDQPATDATETPTPSELATGTPEGTLTETETPTEVLPPTNTETPTVVNPTEMPTPFVPDPIPTDETGQTDGIIIKFKSFVPEIVSDIVINLAEGQVTNQIDKLGLTVMDVPAENTDAILKDLNSNLFVEYAEPDFSGEMMGTPPTDTYYADGHQPDLAAMHVDQTVWDITTGGNVVVAIIDTGVDTSHGELSGRLWENPLDPPGDGDNDGNKLVNDVNGWNFVNNDDNLSDGNGHGTHTAGIIVGNHNSLGIAGIAPGAKIMVLKALDNNGFGRYSDIAAAITYAVSHGADVIQIGFGGTVNSDALQTATNYAYTNNVTIVAAAGNSGTDMNYFPAANEHVIGVGALDYDFMSRATFSTYGSALDLVAPGRGVVSSLPSSGYGGWSGTSVSSAEVTGVVALLASQAAFDTPDKIQATLYGTALTLVPSNELGAGIPQAYEALMAGNTFATPTPGPTAAVTPMPTPPGGMSIPTYEEYWAYTQSCFDNLPGSVTIDNPENSSIGSIPDDTEALDGAFASCTGEFANSTTGGYWKVDDLVQTNGIGTTNIPILNKVVLKTQFYVSQGVDLADVWNNDELLMQVSVDGGTSWVTLVTYNGSNPPPTTLVGSLYVDDISDIVKTKSNLENFQFRIYASNSVAPAADLFKMNLDTVKLEVTANLEPAVTIVGPAIPATYNKSDTIHFVGKATDPEDGDISSRIVWDSHIDGYLGTGSTLDVTLLTPGMHYIRATVTDNHGQTVGSNAFALTINSSTSPHGGFAPDTDSCATCHRDHSAKSVGDLLNYPSSSHESNDFCLSCHSSGGGAVTVQTHSNKHFASKQEDGFELLCIQCHEPHGNTTNLFAVRNYLIDGVLPKNFKSMVVLPDLVTFTSMDSTNSLGGSSTADSVCVACHLNYTMAHPGGENHADLQDYTLQSCIKCHKHTLYTDIIEAGTPVRYPNGFMPITPTPTPGP